MEIFESPEALGDSKVLDLRLIRRSTLLIILADSKRRPQEKIASLSRPRARLNFNICHEPFSMLSTAESSDLIRINNIELSNPINLWILLIHEILMRGSSAPLKFAEVQRLNYAIVVEDRSNPRVFRRSLKNSFRMQNFHTSSKTMLINKFGTESLGPRL